MVFGAAMRRKFLRKPLAPPLSERQTIRYINYDKPSYFVKKKYNIASYFRFGFYDKMALYYEK